MIWYNALFSLQGRLNRQGFWAGIGINFMLLVLCANLLPDPNHTPLSLLPLIFIGYSIVAVITKRLHDRNRSAWAMCILIAPLLCYITSSFIQGFFAWVLGVAMPVFIGTMLIIEWGIFKGNPEANQYGKTGLPITFR